ncbi:IMS domain-containing protein [Chamaesiphon sp. VAR_69_metabat_338]|uniref:IMS domain-containing protein n=1 Tax=Chamaesiphon sp. VAR_69_metabat_338 TaxID=2964704 RepID=UPI00286DB3DD|nr:IMS domain-containing protein [Chamaesiphon sp. VAR_69_metabat_338]
MRIPLDYYQILGVPENDLSELEQAYRDRLLQLPQQEYSDAAIESRKRLITVAYEVLSDPQQRSIYNATQTAPNEAELENTGTGGNVAPSPFYRRRELDIAPEHFLGSLLILFELGEYEEINSICMPYLGNNGRSSNSGSLHPAPLVSGEIAAQNNRNAPIRLANVKHTHNGTHIIPLKPDIVLAMVSSFWELGEREWRDSCYEEATIHYETAKKILVQEDLFPQIQGEIDRRLDRLQPYRISSLVSLPLDRHEQRRRGIQFLEELLESACTNEVKCQERFALNSESTIPFIHETLPHLTAAEQRNLFSQLARDSHQLGTKSLNVMQLACTYLHVHALIAQGFAYRNPQLIYTAQQILQYRLSQRMECSIEQAICAILLGQTEEAERLLACAPESGSLIAIRQQSQGLPNLLRGLCWYIETWLKDEAFPCFRDLVTSDPSLNAYFSDRDVQDFADRMPAQDNPATSWEKSSPQVIDVPPSGDLSGSFNSSPADFQAAESDRALLAKASTRRNSSLTPAWQSPTDRLGAEGITPAVRVEQLAPPAPTPLPTEERDDPNVIPLDRERQRRRSAPTARTIDGQFEETYLQVPSSLSLDPNSQLVTANKSGQLAARPSGSSTIVRPRRPRQSPNIPRILLVGAGGVTCLCGTIWLVNTAIGSIFKQPSPTLTATPSPRVTASTAPIPKEVKTLKSNPVTAAVLSADVATAIVKKWLSAKTSSMSPQYRVEQLKDILVEPALSSATERAQEAKTNGIHWQYQHQHIGIVSIDRASPQATTARIEAKVEEDAQYYEGERLNPERSYSKQLLVEYNLVRQKDGWYITNMGVVK